MPNRILREGILTSPRMSRLGWAEEVFYRRLHSVVDDFGRYFADTGLLRAACYPRQLNKVSDSDIGKWLTVLVEAALVRVYPAEDGESYLEVLDFGQQVRAKKSKFPSMRSACVADAQQMQSNAHLDVSVFVSGSSVAKATGGEPPVVKPKAKIPADMTKEELWKAGKSLLEASGVPAAQCGSFVGKLVKDYTDAVVIEAVRAAVVASPADAKEYLKATCQRMKGERRDPVTVPSDADKATAAYLAEQAEHARKAAPPPDLSALKTRIAVARAA